MQKHNVFKSGNSRKELFLLNGKLCIKKTKALQAHRQKGSGTVSNVNKTERLQIHV